MLKVASVPTNLLKTPVMDKRVVTMAATPTPALPLPLLSLPKCRGSMALCTTSAWQTQAKHVHDIFCCPWVVHSTWDTVIDAALGEVLTTCLKMDWLLHHSGKYLCPETHSSPLLLGYSLQEVTGAL